MTALLLYPLLTAALFYLGSRAGVTRWLWSRYPAGFGRFRDCASCSGFWYGIAVAAAGGFGLELDFLELSGDDWRTLVVVGLASLAWTPVVAYLLISRLEALGSPEEPGGAD
jgi:hypothetical protein